MSDDKKWYEKLSIEELAEKTRAVAHRLPPKMAEALTEALDSESTDEVIAIIDGHVSNLRKETN